VAAHFLMLIFPALMVYAAAMDVFTMRIANTLSILLVGAFFIIAPVMGMPLQQIGVHLAVGAAALLAAMLLFQLRLIGGGDAKLLAAASVWVGYEQFLPFFVYVTIFGGALALLLLGYRRLPAAAFPLLPDWASRLHNQGEGMPYGVAITAGALLVYPLTPVPLLLAN
jgi:prepilin peptidase CpaA